jgi:hypothetical protein
MIEISAQIAVIPWSSDEEGIVRAKRLLDRVEGTVGERIALLDEADETGGPLLREARLPRIDEQELVAGFVDFGLVHEEEIPVGTSDREEIRARQEIHEPVGLLQEELRLRAVRTERRRVGNARPEAEFFVQRTNPFRRKSRGATQRSHVDLGPREVRRERHQAAPRSGPPFRAPDFDRKPLAHARLAPLSRPCSVDHHPVVVDPAVVGPVHREKPHRV